jgi:hypothetical protein
MIHATKDTLRQLSAARGKLDSDTGQVIGDFVGRLDKADGLYHGVIRYTAAGDKPPGETVSIRSIVTPQKAQKAKKTPLTKESK